MKLISAPIAGALLALSLSLAGCGTSEPTENDMFEAMAASDHNQQMFGSPEKLKVSTKKIGCEKTGEKTYKCTIGQRDGKGMALPLNFTKGDDRWMMLPAS
ncbi:hypothetical protein ACHAC9_18290 [Massilia sp. CMS3.1]|uniref:hypothetical protein n=1 Tax=Massilia sp. CMS3.1 TaxID=3373083 RepID=UPI003EE66A5E